MKIATSVVAAKAWTSTMAITSAHTDRWYAKAWHTIVHMWLSCQIELRGHYSVQRMLAFDAYTRTVNLKRVVQLLLLTFVPGLVIEMVLEAIPLGPFKPGRRTTGPPNFWIRTTIGTYIITHSLVGQYRHSIPRLKISFKQLVGLSIVTTAIMMPIFFAASAIIGFPVPFFVTAAMVPWTPTVVSIGAYILRDQLRREPDILSLIAKYTRVFMAQAVLIVVYPAFSHVFNTHPSSQAALAILLPVIKLALKNWFGYASRHIEDMKPELVVFNVEIFSALYVASCMQNSISMYATGIIMGVDAVQAWISIKDLNDVFNDPEMKHALAHAYSGSDRASTALTTELIPLTIFIVQSNPFVRNHASIGIRTSAPSAQAAVVHATQIAPLDVRAGAVGPPAATAPRAVAQEVQSVEPLRAKATKSFSRLGSVFLLFAQQRIEPDRAELAKVVGRLTNDEQLLVVQKTLKLLHICEFVALIEYAEVFVPVVYSIFITVAYTFPNRDAFVTLRGVPPAQFIHSLKSVLLYGSLELLSYLALNRIMSRKFGVSAFAHTAFVLETQWPMVQSKLTLWMIVVLQFAHSFYGNDFTFQFEWLKRDAPS